MKKGNRTPGGVSVQVKGKNLAIPGSLHDQVVHKMHRLDKYLDRLDELHVELSTEKTRDSDHHNHVEVTAHVPGQTLRVTCVNADMHAAIDEAVMKLYRQLNRKKERMKSHHSRPLDVLVGDAMETAPEATISQPADPGEAAEITRVERLEVKPQFEDEAIAELAGSDNVFYVFLNARNEQVNVLYRRGDGTFGLIEPRTG